MAKEIVKLKWKITRIKIKVLFYESWTKSLNDSENIFKLLMFSFYILDNGPEERNEKYV